MSTRLARIEITKQALNFSIAHFTMFSPSAREDLHGHNYQFDCELVAPVGAGGLMFNYGIVKDTMAALCRELDEKLILPGNSPWLAVTEEDGYVVATFNGVERMPFLPRDVLVLPISNTTVEELSFYLLGRLKDHPDIKDRGIVELTARVSSSPAQRGASTWHEGD